MTDTWRFIKLRHWLIVAVTVSFVAGCVTSNNYLTLRDFADTLERAGIKIEQVQPIMPDVLKAENAVVLTIAGHELGVYKFNLELPQAAKRVDRIRKNGCVYFVGLKYPAMVRGSFVIVGYHSNPKKNEIIKVFERF